MSEIAPLRGVLYNPDKVGGFAKVVAPPYDVISADLQDRLYQTSPFNVVRIDFGKETPKDTLEENRYTRAASLYRDWVQSKILVRDDKPCIYAYCQDFVAAGKSYSRIGFLALAKLEDFGGGIHPHERTLSGPKEDRLKLMRACDAGFSPVFSLYPGEGKGSDLVRRSVEEMEPIADFVDPDGTRNRLWRITDTTAILDYVGGHDLFIADGHHRYETALNYRNERRAANPGHTGNEAYNYVLMMLVDMDDPGLAVLPTHRMVRRPEGIDSREIVNNLSSAFEITTYPDIASMQEQLSALQDKEQSFALYSKTTGFKVLALRDRSLLDAALPEGHSEAWRKLDVNLLHYVVLDRLLGIGPDRWEDHSLIAFTRDTEEAVEKVDSGEFQVAFFLNRTSVNQVRAVSGAGERMPQKSTYFYPKVLTGLVFNDLSSW